MVSEAHQRLSDDHSAVGEVLEQLLTALENRDVRTSYSRLDLLWARLAVHIRAEHLHLFPAVASESSATQSTIDLLRVDHDFFMRELAKAIGVLRELPTSLNIASDEAKLVAVRDTVREIEKRLATHNAIEEEQIYGLAGTILSEPEQLKLATRINAELENRPSRFSADTWGNE